MLNYKIFSKILEAIGTPGLSGLDKLISLYIVHELESTFHYIEKGIRNKTWTSLLDDCETILTAADKPKGKLQACITNQINKLWPQLFDWVLRIGHYQLLRKKIAYELNTACKFEAKHMEAALQTLNTALLSEINKNGKSDQNEAKRCELLHELSIRLDWAGISDPHNKVYIKSSTSNTANVALIMFLLTASHLHKLQYCKNAASLLSKRAQDPVDAVVFALGVQTILRQHHMSVINRYLKYLSVYVLSFITSDRYC